MKENGLLATQTVHKAKRKASQRKPQAVSQKHIWGMDINWNLSLGSRSLKMAVSQLQHPS